MPHFGEATAPIYSVQRATVTSGNTVVMRDDDTPGLLQINGTGTLAALTVRLPSSAVAEVFQIRDVYFNVAVTAITWQNSTSTSLPTSAAKGDHWRLQYIDVGVWT